LGSSLEPRASHGSKTIGGTAATRLFVLFEHAFCWIVVSVYCDAFLPAWLHWNNDEVALRDTNPINQTLQTFILAVMIIMTVRYRSKFLALLRCSWGIVVVTGFCFLSIAWSDAPGISLRRSVVFTVSNAFALYVAARFEIDRLSRIISWSAALMSVSSLVLIVAVPAAGLEQSGLNTGLPRGVFSGKNSMGFMLLICSLFTFQAALVVRRERSLTRALPHWMIWGLSLSLAAAAQSATVVLAMIAGYGCWVGAALIRRYRAIRALIALLIAEILGVLALVLASFPDQAIGLLGKDSSLTGRDELWAAVWSYIRLRPVLGYGYAAFWRDDSPQVTRIWEIIGWDTPHAHNAVLELLLEVGIVGTFLVGIFYAVVWARVAGAVWCGDRSAGLLGAVLTAIFVQSLTEANALHQSDIGWIMLVVANFVAASRKIAQTGSSSPSAHRSAFL